MNEHEPRPAADTESPDWRRLEVALGRFGTLISDGINTALANQTEVDDATARCIAHVLGRAYGRDSALADYGRTGEGQYLSKTSATNTSPSTATSTPPPSPKS